MRVEEIKTETPSDHVDSDLMSRSKGSVDNEQDEEGIPEIAEAESRAEMEDTASETHSEKEHRSEASDEHIQEIEQAQEPELEMETRLDEAEKPETNKEAVVKDDEQREKIEQNLVAEDEQKPSTQPSEQGEESSETAVVKSTEKEQSSEEDATREESSETAVVKSTEKEQSSEEDGTSTSKEALDVPELPADKTKGDKLACDYDVNPTELFLHLQKKEWSLVNERALEHPIEAKTWVSRRDKNGKLRWQLLPVHAAIIFKAPEEVIKSLLAGFPRGAQSKDDQGMLPLHLAFRHGCTEEIVKLLLLAFPQSVEIADRKGRIPLDLASASASPNRDAFIDLLEKGTAYFENAKSVTQQAGLLAEQKALFESTFAEAEEKHKAKTVALEAEKLALAEETEQLQGQVQTLESKVAEMEHVCIRNEELTKELEELKDDFRAQEEENCEQERVFETTLAEVETKYKSTLANVATKYRSEMESVEAANLLEFEAQIKEKDQELRDISSANTVLTNEVGQLKEQLKAKEVEKVALVVNADKELQELTKQMKKDWANAQARAAVLDAQLANKVQSERDLAAQISTLEEKLANRVVENRNSSSKYTSLIHTLEEKCKKQKSVSHEMKSRVAYLEEEKDKLRSIVKDLGSKLVKASQVINKLPGGPSLGRNMNESEAQLVSLAQHQEDLMTRAFEKRQKAVEVLRLQDMEMYKAVAEQFAVVKKLSYISQANVAGLDPKVKREMKDIMDSVFEGIQQAVDTESNLKMTESSPRTLSRTGSRAESPKKSQTSTKMGETSSAKKGKQLPPIKTNIAPEENVRNSLSEALRALELPETKSTPKSGQLTKSHSEDSDDSASIARSDSLESNPSSVE